MEELVLLLLKPPGMQERFVIAGGFRLPNAQFPPADHISMALSGSGV